MVRLYAYFAPALGEREFVLDLPEKAKLRDLLDVMVQRYGQEAREIMPTTLEAGGEVSTLILINGQSYLHLEGMDTVLEEQTQIDLMPPISGG